MRASSLCEHQTHFIVGRRVLALPQVPAATCRQAKRSSHARTAVCAAFLCSSTLLPNRCRIPVSHAFPTPGVSWAGKTVFGRPCHCLLALGSGVWLVGTASARR